MHNYQELADPALGGGGGGGGGGGVVLAWLLAGVSYSCQLAAQR